MTDNRSKKRFIYPILFSALIILLFIIPALAEDSSDADEQDKDPFIGTPFIYNDGQPFSLRSGSSRSYVVLPVDLKCDLDSNGSVNAADARIVLRAAVGLDSSALPEISVADLTDDGFLGVDDARLIMRACVKLDRYYRLADGSVISGFYQTDDGRSFYLGEYGQAPTGEMTVDGVSYCFDAGFVKTGYFTVGGKHRYYSDDGKGYTGQKEINGVTIYFKDGLAYTGNAKKGNEILYYDNGVPARGMYTVKGERLFYSAGKPYTGYAKVGDKKLYYSEGKPAEGTFTINGVKYVFEGGLSFTGWRKTDSGNVYFYNGSVAEGVAPENGSDYFFIKGSKQYSWIQSGSDYYFCDRSSGKLAKDTTVDGLKIGADGKAVKTDYSVEKIKTFIKAKKIVADITDKSDSVSEKKLKCFNWVMSKPYAQYRGVGEYAYVGGWEMLFANDIFDKGNGCCGSTSFAFAFLAVECGCDDVYVCDDGVSKGGHAWVTMNGNNRVYDVIFAEAKSFSKNYDADCGDYRAYAPRKTYIGG